MDIMTWTYPNGGRRTRDAATHRRAIAASVAREQLRVADGGHDGDGHTAARALDGGVVVDEGARVRGGLEGEFEFQEFNGTISACRFP